jgi:hypothetical protein
MSPNHHFARDEYGVLGVYYSGTSPLFQFDVSDIIYELGEWSIAPHVRDFVYDHIEENGGRSLLYAFDGGMENGIDEARGFIGEAVEAYIELDDDEKAEMSKTSLNKLKIEESNFIEKNKSVSALGEVLKSFLISETEVRRYDGQVVDEFKESIIETVRKYQRCGSQLEKDIAEESEWELPTFDEEE